MSVLTDDEIDALDGSMCGVREFHRNFGRAIEAAVLAKLRQQKLTREPVGTFKKQYWIPGSPGVVILHMEKEATMRDGDYVYATPLPAVGQVPQGWRVRKGNKDGEFLVERDGLGFYVANLDGPDIASMILARLASDMLAAAPEAPAQEKA